MRLSSIQNTSKVFALLDFSRVATLARSIGLDIDHLEHREKLDYISSKIMEFVSPECSGVIVDPEFDFDSITKKSRSTGLVMSLEKKIDGADPFGLPRIAENWGIENIANNYGVAKLELYYHPQEPEALKKKQFVAEIYDYCKYVGIDLLLELIVYHPASEEVDKAVILEAQLQAVKEFAGVCHILGLEYMDDPLSAVTITADLDVPWIYNAREVDYETFKQNLRICTESGAQGFMAGDPFWTEEDSIVSLGSNKTFEQQSEFIKTILRDKVIEATRIAAEVVAQAPEST